MKSFIHVGLLVLLIALSLAACSRPDSTPAGAEPSTDAATAPAGDEPADEGAVFGDDFESGAVEEWTGDAGAEAEGADAEAEDNADERGADDSANE